MLRSALVIAAVGVGLAWYLAHSELPNRSMIAAAIRGGVGESPALVPSIQQASMPALPPVQRVNVGPDTFAIDADRWGQFETSMIVAGRELPALVDTGAAYVALTYDAAASIGFHPANSDFTIRLRTANGTALGAPVTLASIRVGNVEARNVPAIVHMPGALVSGNLLGMTFLRRLNGFEIQSGRLVLKQ